MINSDIASYVSCGLLALSRMVQEMRRRSIVDENVYRVVFANANAFLLAGS